MRGPPIGKFVRLVHGHATVLETHHTNRGARRPCKRIESTDRRVVHDIIDNEVVIIHFDTGSYYSVDSAGADVWTMVEKGATHDQIAGRVIELYEGDPREIDDATTRFLAELEREDLIVCDSNGIAAIASVSENAVESRGMTSAQFSGFNLEKYTDLADLLLLDPIHEVDEAGWPHKQGEAPVADRMGHGK